MYKKFSYYLPSLGQSWMLVLLMLICGSILGAIAQLPILTNIYTIESIAGQITTKVVAYLLLFLAPIIFILYKVKHDANLSKLTLKKIERVRLNKANFGKLNPFVFFILIFIGLFCLIFLMDPLTDWMPQPEWFTKLMETAVGGNIYITIFGVAICAAFCEEFFCRGIILRGLLRHLSPTKAIIWSAFIFAFIHLNPWQGISAFIFGLFFGWIYYKTHCLWCTIFLHFTNNFFSCIADQIFPNMNTELSLRMNIANDEKYWLILSIAFGLFTVIWVVITKYIPTSETNLVFNRKKNN